VSTYFALRQARYTRENFRIQLGNDLVKWGNEAINLFSQAESLSFHSLDTDADSIEFYVKRNDILCQLSALIDNGRMYFPNVEHNIVGLHKDEAYRGYRRPILDDLTHSFRIIKGYRHDNADSNHEIRRQINKYRRQFVSRLQKSVDPRRRIAFLEKELRQPSLGGELK
jgi:hypothetical protein